jgi:thioredoxin
MNKILPLFFVFVTMIACSQKKQNYYNISVSEFKNSVSENDIILDVRTEEETEQGQINRASSLDFYSPNFENSLSLIQKDKKVYIYCLSGGRSKKAAEQLAQMGQFKVYNIQGGIRDWIEKGYELTPAINKKTSHNLEVSLDSLNNAINQNDLAFISFQTKWCAPCRKMDPVIDELKEQNPHVAFLKVDMDKNKDLANIFEVKSIPTFFIFKNKKESWRATGLQQKDEIQKLLQ